MSAPEPASRDANLVTLILALLTPMFLWSTAGDIRLAHVAAAQTLNEYRIANRLSLFTVAKIIAFDIATLSSLSLSMYEDVSMLLALRLRGNANSLDRSAERNRRRLELEQASRSGATDETEDSVEAAIAEAQRMVNEAAAPAPVPPTAAAPAARTSAQQRQAGWARAMTSVAEEFTDGLKDLPPAERWKEMARIEALSMAAADLASGTALPPVPMMAAE